MGNLDRVVLNPSFRFCSLMLSPVLLFAGIVPVTQRNAAAAPGMSSLAAPPTVWDTAREPGRAPRRAGELIVRFRENVAEQVKNSAVKDKGGRRLR